MSLSSLWRGVIPKGFELVAGDKRSAITGVQITVTHPEGMPAPVCLASLRDAMIVAAFRWCSLRFIIGYKLIFF